MSPFSLLVIGVFIIIIVYLVVPDLFLHRLGIGSSKRQYTSGVALTFDDGPNPEYTPKILDILDRYKVPATFFVVGEKALMYPELIERIQKEGHQLGLHCHKHVHAWRILNPRKTWIIWDEGLETLQNLTGKTIEWIRPPWGTFNLALWVWIKINHKRAVLWDVKTYDWQIRRSPLEIAQQVLSKAKEGSIILLHDSGGDIGAPKNTINALEIICRDIPNKLKLPIVNLEFPPWSSWHTLCYSLWEKWENFYAHFHQVERLNTNNLLRISKAFYKGPNLYSSEGNLLVKQGDYVGIIHLDNVRLLRKEMDIQKLGLQTLREIKVSLKELAKFINENPKYKEIKIIQGVSLINRGVRGLGFQVEELPSSLHNRIIGLLQRIILHIYHPHGKKRVGELLNSQPKIVWMSREQLMEKWLIPNQNKKIPNP